MRLAALALGCLAAFAILEVSLRVLDPFSVRIRGNRISLPKNVRLLIKNEKIDNVDSEITVTRNQLGFRGPNPPADIDSQLSILAVGGSTTECFYLSDGATWPERMASRLEKKLEPVWVNNAGLDGHSTFGHSMLLENYIRPMRPKVVVFLIGVNDVGNDSLTGYDRMPHQRPKRSRLTQIGDSIAESFVTVQYLDNIRRSLKAKQLGLEHGNVNHEQLKMLSARQVSVTDSQLAQMLRRHQSQFLNGYRRRVEHLLQATRKAGAEPVLVTQPALYGEGVDPSSGVDLGAIAIDKINGAAKWRILEMYNDVTRSVGLQEKALVIDLALELPKDSKYFYDFIHFSNEGADAVGEIVAKRLEPRLRSSFPDFVKRAANN